MACEAMLQYLKERLPGLELPWDNKAYGALHDFNVGPYLLEKARGHLQGEDWEDFQKILQDLLQGRNLWKRVFELPWDLPNLEQQRRDIRGILREQGLPFREQSCHLLPLESFVGKKASLKVIQKDPQQFLKVRPLSFSTTRTVASSLGQVRFYVPHFWRGRQRITRARSAKSFRLSAVVH